MNKGKRQEREAFWQQQLEQLQASGQSAMGFARQHDLSYHQLIYWRKKLVADCKLPAQNGAGFARVAVSAPQALPLAQGLRLDLPGGLSISGIDHGNLDLVLSMLGRL